MDKKPGQGPTYSQKSLKPPCVWRVTMLSEWLNEQLNCQGS